MNYDLFHSIIKLKLYNLLQVLHNGKFLIFFLHSIVKDMFKKKTKTNQVLIN